MPHEGNQRPRYPDTSLKGSRTGHGEAVEEAGVGLVRAHLVVADTYHPGHLGGQRLHELAPLVPDVLDPVGVAYIAAVNEEVKMELLLGDKHAGQDFLGALDRALVPDGQESERTVRDRTCTTPPSTQVLTALADRDETAKCQAGRW